ncbi:transposase-like protein [Paraburkholderia fungorum]|nr:transposase-like protein [Paraburkholderia fungorum]
MKEGKLPKRQYTQEFKAEAVRLAASVGGHGTSPGRAGGNVGQLVQARCRSDRRQWRGCAAHRGACAPPGV